MKSIILTSILLISNILFGYYELSLTIRNLSAGFDGYLNFTATPEGPVYDNFGNLVGAPETLHKSVRVLYSEWVNNPNYSYAVFEILATGGDDPLTPELYLGNYRITIEDCVIILTGTSKIATIIQDLRDYLGRIALIYIL